MIRRYSKRAFTSFPFCAIHGRMTDEPAFHAVCHVKDYETGELFAIEPTTEYSRRVIEFNAAECQHPETTPYRIKVANGNIQVRNCCTNCGHRVSTPLPQKDKAWVASLDWQPEEHAETYKSRRDAERHALLLKLGREQYAERGKFTHSYKAYMASEEWRMKRTLVMKRCGSICEGCGIREATEVHHTTYAHFANEFLFELLGLCHDCHERITNEGSQASNDDEPLAANDPDFDPFA